MMALRSLLALSLATMLAPATPAGASFFSRCGDSAGSVHVSHVEPEVRVSHERGLADIERIAGRKGGTPFGVGSSQATGVTLVSMGVEQKFTIRTKKTLRGYCSEIEDVHLTVQMTKPIEVYVARELDAHSCARQATLDHELQHVRLYSEALRQGASDMRASIPRGISSSGWSFEANDRYAAEAGVSAMVTSVVSRATERMTAAAEASNGRIDTPESYRSLSRSCPTWPATRR